MAGVLIFLGILVVLGAIIGGNASKNSHHATAEYGAAHGAVGGFLIGLGCLVKLAIAGFYCAVAALPLFIGFWILSSIFG